MGFGIRVEVAGPRACFTRPEMKAERVSYDVITPSAARGILEAVYWKPAIRWVIDGIDVINPIKFDAFRRNEVESKMSYRNARQLEQGENKPFYLDSTASRQQRATLLLRDVRYVITAHFEMTEQAGAEDTPEKHYNIALRRLRKGQCFNQPYLGCREFAVTEMKLVESSEQIRTSYYEGAPEYDLGFMLYDIDFANEMDPIYYRPIIINGHIDVAALREGMVR